VTPGGRVPTKRVAEAATPSVKPRAAAGTPTKNATAKNATAKKATAKKVADASRKTPPTHWTASETASALQAKAGLSVVPSLMSWVKDGGGKPNAHERNLFMAAVAFAYGVWENYVEQLALELVNRLSEELDPSAVPDEARRDFTKSKDAWEIAISPGWKELWRERVRDLAIGDDTEKFGLNTANTGQVRNLFRIVGVDPFAGVEGEKVDRIADLVRLRGQIVHTAKVPDDLRKADPISWGDFVSELVDAVDDACRKQAAAMLGPARASGREG